METFSDLRVFIVDDNEVTRAVLRMILKDRGFQVIGEAADARAALERLAPVRADMVCLDVVMPGCDGLDLLQQIKQRAPRTEILMVTASKDAATIETALARGAAGFIFKPFNSGAVCDAMEKVARRMRTRHTAAQVAQTEVAASRQEEIESQQVISTPAIAPDDKFLHLASKLPNLPDNGP
ncbi:response regulator transcription factor [Duganella vulcania]|uniref:Response regulator n=1 Tax=Duganella vulcania TaxID=2692166 RepID=A0A845GIM5_9BURK|nr:response regulator [Duganella vulcania]MYM92519.1 response regulator [Duganella vulcania]